MQGRPQASPPVLGVLAPAAAPAAPAAAEVRVPRRPQSATIRSVLGEHPRRPLSGSLASARRRPQTAGSRGGWRNLREAAAGEELCTAGAPLTARDLAKEAVAAVKEERRCGQVGDAADDPTIHRTMECMRAMGTWRPLQSCRDDNQTAAFGALAVEVGVFTVESDALLCGGGDGPREQAMSIALGTTSLPPLEARRTARAVSLLLRLVECFPAGTQLRSLFEPLVHEVLRAVYQDWEHSPGNCKKEELLPEALESCTTHYAACRAFRETAAAIEEKLKIHMRRERDMNARLMPLEQQLKEQRARVEEAERLKREAEEARIAADARCEQFRDEFENSEKLLRFYGSQLHEFDERQFYLQDEVRVTKQGLCAAEKYGHEKGTQLGFISQENRELKEANEKMRADLERNAPKLKELGKLRSKVKHQEAFDAVPKAFWASFSRRIVDDVFGADDLLGDVGSQALTLSETKMRLDRAVMRLKSFPLELEALRAQLRRKQFETEKLRLLVPVWNAGSAKELQQELDAATPIFERLYIQKDQRSFIGLGMSSDLPPYLRAEGPVQHIFLSKMELENFIASFLEVAVKAARREQEHGALFTPEMLHLELYQHIRSQELEKEREKEFSYALICSIAAYIDDPDFEQLSLLLSGKVHPFIHEDQKSMLSTMENLVLRCLDGAATFEAQMRLICGVMQAMFPDKPADMHNALRRAMHLTVGSASELGSIDQKALKNMFQTDAEGSQSPFVTEARRQHHYEVVQFSDALARRLRASWRLSRSQLRSAVAAHGDEAGRALLEKIAFGDDFVEESHAKGTRLSPEVRSPEARRASADATVTGAEAFERMSQGALLRPARLWVAASQEDVHRSLAEKQAPEHEPHGQSD